MLEKFSKLLLLILLCMTIKYDNCFANISTENVRIGLEYKYKGVQSVSITDKEIMFGYEINGFYTPNTTLKSQTGFVMRVSNSYYVSTGNKYNSYEQALQKAIELNILGIKSSPASLNSSSWTVYCGGYNSFNEATAILPSVGEGANVVAPNNKMTELTNGSAIILVCDNSNSYPRIAALQGDIITLYDRKYRGQIEFNRTSSAITAINVLNIEDYLCGSVPAEMPSQWHIEAIKAQAVAARTYTSKTRKHTNQDYDLCDSTHCQAYIGYTNESNTTTQAVKATQGQKIYYNNELIEAIYFSSSGGYTNNSENVWNNALPYLRGVPDIYEKEYKSWTRTITLNDLSTLLSQNGFNIGKATDMKIDSYTDGGRVNALTVFGTSGVKTLTKEDIRTFFKPSLESNMFQIISGGSIVSDNITVQSDYTKLIQSIDNIKIRGNDGILKQVGLNSSMYVLDGNGNTTSYSMKAKTTTSASDTFIISGKGYGHGVGMSQYGAKGMAETGSGFTYIDILRYYYTGVNIQ